MEGWLFKLEVVERYELGSEVSLSPFYDFIRMSEKSPADLVVIQSLNVDGVISQGVHVNILQLVNSPLHGLCKKGEIILYMVCQTEMYQLGSTRHLLLLNTIPKVVTRGSKSSPWFIWFIPLTKAVDSTDSGSLGIS